jgi:lysophospholipase L1-like esterase
MSEPMLPYLFHMRRLLPRPALAAAVAALALVLTACNALEETPVPGEGLAEMAEAGDPERDRYVALGDSYTAAPHRPMPERVKGCMRSRENYPRLVAEELENTKLVDVSCSGASTDSMFIGQGFDHGGSERPPQLDALTPETDLVTVSIGANDFRLFSSMIYECLDVGRNDPDGAPCRELNARGKWDRLERTIKLIEPRVTRVVEDIKERSPAARILIVGYPQLLPETGSCPRRLPLASGDYEYALRINQRLSNAVRDGGVSAGAEYIDLYAASKGHDICSDDPWVAGIRGDVYRAMGLHPYPAEQRAVAELILSVLSPGTSTTSSG